jgi:hypothetical protein
MLYNCGLKINNVLNIPSSVKVLSIQLCEEVYNRIDMKLQNWNRCTHVYLLTYRDLLYIHQQLHYENQESLVNRYICINKATSQSEINSLYYVDRHQISKWIPQAENNDSIHVGSFEYTQIDEWNFCVSKPML